MDDPSRRHVALFSGSANPALAAAIARELGVTPGRCTLERFPDGESSVRLDDGVCGRDVVLVQPTAPPVNDHLVELLALADACRRGVAARITAVVPYYGYSRSDKRHLSLEPIMGRVVADVLQSVGIGHVLTMDLHTPQIEGFFRVPVESLTAMQSLCTAMRPRLPRDVVVVAPDAGRALLAAKYAECLGAPVVVLHKRRASGEVEMVRVVGEVEGKACLLVDDMISTGGTLEQAIRVLLDKGAQPNITIAATHGLFIGPARERLRHPAVQSIYVTDTIVQARAADARVHVVSVAAVFAAALARFLDAPVR
jgi:ribose-phosphate pyrophosphokinase